MTQKKLTICVPIKSQDRVEDFDHEVNQRFIEDIQHFIFQLIMKVTFWPKKSCRQDCFKILLEK